MHKRLREYPATGWSSTKCKSFYDEKLDEANVSGYKAYSKNGGNFGIGSIEIEEFVDTLSKEAQEQLNEILTQKVVAPPAAFQQLMSQGPAPMEVMWRQLSLQKNMNSFLYPLSAKTISWGLVRVTRQM